MCGRLEGIIWILQLKPHYNVRIRNTEKKCPNYWKTSTGVYTYNTSLEDVSSSLCNTKAVPLFSSRIF